MLWVSFSNLSCNPRSYPVILDISTPKHFILKSKRFPGENIGSRQLCSTTSTYDGDDLCTSPNYCKLVLGEIDVTIIGTNTSELDSNFQHLYLVDDTNYYTIRDTYTSCWNVVKRILELNFNFL